MSATDDTAARVARLTGAFERQAEELRSLRTQLGDRDPVRLLRADDVAARLAKSRAWVYRNQQGLGGFRVGGQLRFEADGIDRYVERCQSGSRPVPAKPLLPLRPNARAKRPGRA